MIKRSVIARSAATKQPRGTASPRSGFTFIEVMVAMLLFVMAVLAAIGIAQGSVRATRDARENSIASWLVQKTMVELETRLETEGFDKGCEKKKEGKFTAPYENYAWVSYCDEIDFNLTDTASKLAKDMQDKDKDSSNPQAQQNSAMQNLILKTASEYITKSLRELHTEVYWIQGKQKKMVDLTTHLVRYDQPLAIPGIPGAPAAPGASPAPGAPTPVPGGASGR